MQSRARILFPVVLILLITIGGCINPMEAPTVAIHSHLPQEITGSVEIWRLDNVYAHQSNNTPMMASNAGKLVILGSTRDNEEYILCFDGANGNILWHKDPTYHSTLFSTTDGIYVGYYGTPYVKKYDWSTGELIWSQSLSGRSVWFLFVAENEVQVLTGPDIFSILHADSGELLKKVAIGEDIYAILGEQTILPEIRAIETNTGKLIWQIELDDQPGSAPLFVDDAIYLRTGRTLGSVYAIQRSTGDILWKTDRVIVSNIAVSEVYGMAFVLTRNGELWKIDKDTGNITTLVKFSASPFILNGDAMVGGYELAFDDSTQMLYVLLGDSRQLFAFQVR